MHADTLSRVEPQFLDSFLKTFDRCDGAILAPWPNYRMYLVHGRDVAFSLRRLKGSLGHLAWTARHYPGGREFLFHLAEGSL